MPYDWVPPEVAFNIDGVKIYHLYKGDSTQNPPREHWYALSEFAGENDDDGPTGEYGVFDVRELPQPSEGHDDTESIIRNAITTGYFDDWSCPLDRAEATNADGVDTTSPGE